PSGSSSHDAAPPAMRQEPWLSAAPSNSGSRSLNNSTSRNRRRTMMDNPLPIGVSLRSPPPLWGSVRVGGMVWGADAASRLAVHPPPPPAPPPEGGGEKTR